MRRGSNPAYVFFGKFINGEVNGLLLSYRRAASYEGYFKDGVEDGMGITTITTKFTVILEAEYTAGKQDGFSIET